MASSKFVPTRNKKFFFLGNPNFKVDWDDVEFVPDKIKYKRLLYKEMENEDLLNVLFKTVLKNDSKLVQQHTLRAKRRTVYGCESFLIEGYTKGSKVGMSIPLPNGILEAGIGISKSFTINHTKGNSEEKQVEWDVEDSIQVPGKSTITVEIKTKEKQSEFEFQTRVGFKGNVGGTFYNKNQQIIRTFTIPISSIINDLPDDMIVTEDNIIYIKINGRIKYKYDIEHDIVINNLKQSVCAIL